jgi:transposase
MKQTNRRTFTAEFKKQMVQLYQNGKARQEIIKEYDLTPSALDRWVKQYNTSGSFKEKDNRSSEEQELLQLQKEIKQLRMENDILKQAALIMGRK